MAFEEEKVQLIDKYFGPSKYKTTTSIAKEHFELFLKDTNNGKVYKYREINEHTISAIKTNELYCSSPLCFNDPFDCNLGMQLDIAPILYSFNKDKRSELLDALPSVIRGESSINDYPIEYQAVLNNILNNGTILKTLSAPIGKIDTKEEMLNFILSHKEFFIEMAKVIFSSETFGIPGVKFPDDFYTIFSNSSDAGKLELLSEHPSIKDFSIANEIDEDIDDIERLEKLYKKLYPEKADSYIPFEAAVPKTTIDLFTVGCLASSFTNRLMWSHYAASHSGLCIEYDYHNIEKDEAISLPYPVVYSIDRPTIPYLNILDSTPEAKQEMVHSIVRGLLTKDKAWEYESEWRILNPKDKYFFKMPKISAIYLGIAISDTDKNQIIELAKELDIPVKQMSIDRCKYDLHAKDI